MKKIFLLLLIITLAICISTGCAPTVAPTPSEGEGEGEGEAESTGDRVVLMELFNADGCSASELINPIAEDLAESYGTGQVILIEGAAWGKYTTSEVQSRFDWYVPGTKHTPFIAFNGLSNTFSEGVIGGGGGGSTPVNHAPTITSTPSIIATVGVEYNYDVDATDPDGDTLIYSLTTKPTDMTINSSSGLISWTPTQGHYDVVVEVSDGSLTDTQSFTIYVVDQFPIITSTPITTATVGVEYNYDVDAADPDGDTLIYSLTTKPTDMTINSSSGLISWTPTATHIGGNPVVVEVSGFDVSTSQSFTIVVPGSLSGTIVSDVGGPAVGGSLVDVKQGAAIISTTTTNDQGRFGVADLPDGTYDIVVTQYGKATSKAQDVHIISSQTTIINLVQKEVNVPAWECESPAITVTGISEGDTISGAIAGITVNIDDDSDVKYIFIGADYIPNQLECDFAYYDTSNVTLPSVNTTFLSDGDFQMVVVAYDMNYNRTQYAINVIIDNSNVGTVPEEPEFWPIAVTIGEKISYFSLERRDKFANRSIEIDPNIIQLAEGKQIDLDAVINTAENDSNLFIKIYCEPSSFGDNIVGYSVYRKFEGETNYQYIGSVPTYSLDESAVYYDTDPYLAVGRKTFYKIKALNAYGESEFSYEMWTTPLAKFNLNLISPSDGAVDISIRPTLVWQPLQEIGVKQFYKISLRGKNDSYNLWEYNLWNNTSIEYSGSTLQYLKIYEWNIYEAYAYNYDYDYTAVSIASDYNGSLNGAFEFTTQSESE